MKSPSERGVALILVIFVVALASILVVNLTYSTHLAARVNAIHERSFRAEYMLKSGVNVARVLLKEDDTPDDGPQDTWGKFSTGVVVPAELLAIREPNVSITLEIRPEEAKIPIRALVPTSAGTVDNKWRDVLARLFEKLGFDTDEEADQSGHFPGRVFTSKEVVASLIDYMDADSDSYSDPSFAAGVEGDLPAGTLANQRPAQLGALANVPGFSPDRLRRVSPFLTVFGSSFRINVNLAPELVIQVLNEGIDESMVETITAFRSGAGGPFTQNNQSSELSTIVGASVYNDIAVMITSRSSWFQVLSKIDYGNSVFFMRAYLARLAPNELPEIRSVEMF